MNKIVYYFYVTYKGMVHKKISEKECIRPYQTNNFKEVKELASKDVQIISCGYTNSNCLFETE